MTDPQTCDPSDVEILTGGQAFDPGKQTILIVSHEAQLTGAPILSLNLVRRFQHRYNVVALLLGGGPLVDDFRASCVALVPLRAAINAVQVTVGRILDTFPIQFAVANSVETSPVLETLAQRAVPSLVLIHEFAAYTRPRWKFINAFFWADEVVFSTRLTYEEVIRTYPRLADRRCHFVPQGRCELLETPPDPAAVAEETARIRSILRPAGTPGDAVLFVGIGSVQMRKGVELFIDCAAKIKKALGGRACRFAWIGHGYNPEYDLLYSVYLADQIRRMGLSEDLVIMENTFLVEEIYRSADMLLLTSRLDPLPGVAIEAMSHRLPVVCFDRTTGIADVLKEHGLGEPCVAPYLDTHVMADKAVAFVDDPTLKQRIGDALSDVANGYFSMERYVDALDGIAQEAVRKVEADLALAAELEASGVMRRDFLAPPAYGGSDADVIRLRYLRPWAAGFDHLKPFPGFHPGVYAEQQAEPPMPEPTLHYLRAGRPAGPWHHDVIVSEDWALDVPADLRVALQVHAYYPEFLPEIIIRLGLNRYRPDLLISVPNAQVEAEAREITKDYPGPVDIRIVPNRGRDFAPLLTTFAADLPERYDIVGHVHTKKTADLDDRPMIDRWRALLVENMLGSKGPMVDLILGRMAHDPGIGIVFPDDPNFVGWGENKAIAQDLCERLGLPRELPDQFVFPVGTMFWARVDALRPLFELGLRAEDYPAEPLPYDGSMLHALERLLPFVAAHRGYRTVLTNVTGLTR